MDPLEEDLGWYLNFDLLRQVVQKINLIPKCGHAEEQISTRIVIDQPL